MPHNPDLQQGTQKVMIKTSEGISAFIYSLVFVSLFATEVYSCTANVGRSIKEVDSLIPWMNQRPTAAA
jgi:hypothetical protein